MSVQDIYSALDRIGGETRTSDLQKTCQELSRSRKPTRDVVKNLSEFILNINDAKLFKQYLSNILLALVSAKVPLKPVFTNVKYDLCSDEEKKCHLDYSIVLAELSDHPDVLQYALKYFDINKVPPFEVFIYHEDSYNVAPKKRRLLDYRHKITDHQLVQSCYKLLTKLPNELATKWDWTTFVNNFSNNENAEIRWMIKESMAILTNMTEAQSKILSRNLNLTDQDSLKSITAHENDIVCTMTDMIKEGDLNKDSVVNIDGILLPLYDKSNVQDGNLVPVKSTVNNLRSLALAVASGQALSLMGPVGSGKTSLVEHLAAITGRKGVAFKKVQLGDQTDSRMLLGGHQCTDVPGEFVWRPGVLTEAVQNGHWLLLEDIDSAALDVASTLSSLLERNALCVPGYRDSLPVTPGFQLFVTQRTLATNYGFQKKMSNSSTLLQKHLTQINVEPLSRSELSEIIQTVYPSLSTICTRMLEVFMMFSVGSHDTSLQSTETSAQKSINIIRGSRLISTRDLMKWCSRSVVGFHVSSPDSALKVLQDALDIFTCSVASPEHRLQLAKEVGTCLGIVETKSEFYCKHYKPNVSLNSMALEVGRAKVPRVEKSLETIDFDNKQVVFSFTRQSACLLERIACCVTSNEPVLLVGETGTGKTSSVQYLARQTGHKLIVINMNQQSDSADLLGGYKPVDLKYVIRPIRHEFEKLFKSFYNVDKNVKFLGHIDTCYETENWTALLTLMKQSHKAALNRLTSEKKEKKLRQWLAFGHKLAKLDQQVKAASRLTFAFIEGSLVKAMQEGHWVLLDEINLASAEILECLAGLLEDKSESIDLLEKGDKVPIQRHPDFTLFACMNPATDVGKKDLPVGLRNRFTEFFIDELTERNDLMLLIGDYLYHMNLDGATLEAIFSFYSSIRKQAKLSLVDGAGNAPHYSLRTLCRALMAAAKAKCGTVARSLYEAFCLSFLTQLDSSSHPVVEAMIAKAVIGKKHLKSVLNQLIPEPRVLGQNYLLFEGHWIPQGKLEINIPEGYILTPTVRKNLRDIARIISLGRLPVLLQGDTSVGKTSLITYIAKASGNYCVRINNHEHTDLQEYIGSYATDASGKLVFKEGVLVEAMRKGYWIILDELNLAPSDVLEALNRVLDDNRELFIPETQQVVKADPNFMLFATQNPPGLYGGRKMLSRAFRNRFVELHFDEIPKNELETILHQRCHVPPAYSKKMINVMADLQIRRRGSAAVQGKDGFITLRDLFRWGQRYKHASKEALTDDKFYDWDQHIADEGYLILAGKVRQPDERTIIEEVIEKHIKRKVSADNLFSLHQATSPVTKHILEIMLNNQLAEFSHVVWTYNMRRLAVLIAKAFTFDEPVLLVGETGCGKTTICQVLAALKQRHLLSVNCHMHTESSDFLGGLRPVRQYKNDGRLFEWVDGPLIKAMESGNMFLADEISLADDSVLERLNSLLEPERQLVLAERGMEDNSDIVVITAEKNFHFVGTMNPGGDFGKKELSPALRNRFTEIWCDSVTSREDLLKVLEKSVSKGISLGNQEDGSSGIGHSILDFSDWLKNSEVTNKFPFSIRDLLSWVQFINTTVAKRLLDTPEAYVHGACMTFLDCFGTALTGHIDPETLVVLRTTAINFLLNQIKVVGNEYMKNLREMLSNKQTTFIAEFDDVKFGIKPFYIEVGQKEDISESAETEQRFTFTAPTTGSNTLRLLRGMQLNKAILLEGNPGVGKTSLVTALAKSSGHKVVRINLSDQTDITDLFGTDLPTEDGSFSFKEGAFLTALQNGDWILLDELNLAPQPVLEGLNACLDHRGEVFIPELGKTFKVKQQTKLFACQNPLKQGGARRGLPISFLNRFTQVYIDVLTKEDLIYIVECQYPSIPKDILHRIVQFNCKVAHEITELQSWAHRGSPWEMNLRDIQRWCEAIIQDQNEGKNPSPGKFVDILYVNRMRTADDKERMTRTYDEIFNPDYPRSASTPQFQINEKKIILGDVVLDRQLEKRFKNRRSVDTNFLVLRNQLPALKALAQSITMNWLSILVGPTATGKSSIVQVLADLTGNELQVVPVTSAMDVSDLLGGFEQVDYNRNLENLYDKIETLTIETVRNMWVSKNHKEWIKNKLLSNLYDYKNLMTPGDSNNLKRFREKVYFLSKHCENLIKCNEPFSFSSTKLLEMLANLKKLESRVSKAISVNAGGKFEWVDSLLVKTMIEGSWLLLDNVNLTSSAVLDRLNGLLEPNGVLCIPERGDMSEIKPHPNFRVFFTMDPKYGEISRAMRNRGVEIFLLRPDEFNSQLSDTISSMDLAALLSSCGLANKFHDLCIKLHELMTSHIQGLDRPSISQLLQAAHLTSQQLVRGLSENTALVNSFSDVYIKPRCGADFTNPNMSLAEIKNAMLKAIEKEVLGHMNDTDKSIDSKDTTHTLTVKGLSANSELEIARQIAYIGVQESLNPKENMNSLYAFLSIFNSYTNCPKQLLQLCYNIVNDSLTNQTKNSMNILAGKLNENAFKHLLKCSETQCYKRFYPESYKQDDLSTKAANTRAVLLFNDLLKLVTESTRPKDGFSVLDYSNAVASGSLTDDFVEYPILKQCHNYLKIIDNHVVNAITEARGSLDDEISCRILQLLNWRSRFLKLASEAIFVTSGSRKRPQLREDIVPLLNIHNKWLQKHLIGELFKLLPENHNLTNQFQCLINDMLFIEKWTKHSEEIDAKLLKLSKKLRKLCGQPKLYESKDEYSLCLRRSEIYKNLTLNVDGAVSKQLDKLSVDIATVTDISLAQDIPDENKLVIIDENLAKIGRNVTISPAVLSELKVLPLTSYVLQRVLTMLQTDFVAIISQLTSEDDSRKISVEVTEVLKSFVTLCKKSKGFPPAFLNLLELVQNILETGHDSQRISSVPAKFWDEFYKAVVNSPAFQPLPFLQLELNLTSKDPISDVPASSKRLSSNLPLMPYYVQKLTVSSDAQESRMLLAYETVSLENRVNYSIQLDTVSNVLWKNIALLDSSATLKLKSDAKFELKKFEQLCSYLRSIIAAPNTSEQNGIRKVDLIKDTYSYLESYFKECTTFVTTFETAMSFYNSIKASLSENSVYCGRLVKLLTARLSIQTSTLFVVAMSEVNSVDHVERYRLKVQYIEEDVQMFEALLSTYYFHGLVTGAITDTRTIEKPSQISKEYYNSEDSREALKKVHPYCGIIMDLKEQTADKIQKYALGNTFRPEEPSYNSFVKDCKHFTKSVLSNSSTGLYIGDNITGLLKKMYHTAEQNKPYTPLLSEAEIVVRETSTRLYSINAFYKKVENTYSEPFPDLAKPLLSSLSQMIRSLTLVNDLIMEEILVKGESPPHLTHIVKHLMMYPSLNVDEFEKIDSNSSYSTDGLLKLYLNASCADKVTADLDIITVLKTQLIKLTMQCTAKDAVEKRNVDAMLSNLNQLVGYWEQQQREIERKKQDDEALFVTKSKCEDEDEEAMATEEIQEMFPSYSDDFADFKPPTLEQKPVKKQNTDTNKTTLLISSEDVSSVYKWHSNFVRNMTSADWLPARKKLLGNHVVSVLLQMYPIFSRIIEKRWQALDADLEGDLTPSLLVLVSQIKAIVDGDDSSYNKIDFYRSAWVSETRQCVPLLQKVKETTNIMLDQWPDFPTLKEIIVIANRILAFPVTSPITRFLTGLELLRDKIEEWNKNAHKGNNMVDVSLEVGQQIINWRKLEMAHWKECLNNLYQRKESEAHKYWFFLYAVVNTYLEPDKDGKANVVSAEMIRVLIDFMEKSNLAEYEVRLDIIYAFHCHLVHLEPTQRRDELISILWNTYNYYSQFSAQLASHIKEKRAPIEKKLKDFVKICTWDRDLSYWSVKDTVEKAHKALHKHTQEFEKVLKASVTSCLVDNSTDVSGDVHVGIWDRPKRATNAAAPSGGAYMIDVANHIVLARNVKKYLDEAEQPSKIIPETGLLSKVTNLLNKAKTLCKDTITNTGYPSLVQALDDFVTLVIETSNHLGSLEIDASSPKEKQTSQAKNIIQQKRKSLADLFKYLSKMGLNYRTGLVILSAAEHELHDFTIPPVDLDAAMSYLKSRRCDASLALLWSGCEKYFQKNIARHRLLSAALLTPHQDLGIPNIERCKGFAAQLVQHTYTQKKSISKYSRRLCDLRTLSTNLTNALEIDSTDANISTLNQKLDLLTDCYAKTSVTLEQFGVLLKSLPEKAISADYEADFDAVLSDSKIVQCYKNSDEWKDLYKRVNGLRTSVNKQNNALHKLASKPKKLGQSKDAPVISQSHIDVAEDAKKNIKTMIGTIEEVLNEYQFRFKTLISDFEPKHPILRSIIDLSKYLKDVIGQIEKLDEYNDVTMVISGGDLVNQTEDLVATMLLIIQSVYKKHLPQENENSEVINAIDEIILSGEKASEEPKDILEDRHLKELLQEKLTSDTRMLQLDTLINKLNNLLTSYVEHLATNKNVEEVRSVVMRLVPILEQTVLFVQYFVTQKVAVHRVSCKMLSVLLKIFTDLATKGFCKPSDLDMEEGEGEGGPGKLSGGTGLGEGDGQKDVSERIENQDQLEDAHRPGEEKKEEERDCKEEEKGINMTDDFDSHLQDVEKKEGDDSDKEDDENDADKQMGETDNAAEKLDQQIWGSEDEEDPEESDKKEKEDKGKGESTGEKEMAAKEKEQGTDDGEDGKDKKQKKDINELEEPEVDDDHVDPYHGNQPQYPEPEDFDLPDNMDVDGEDGEEKEPEGETESENPFEIDVMKDMPEENEPDKDKEENRDGLDVSSDEDDGQENGDKEGGDQEDKEDSEQLDNKAGEDDKSGPDETENPDAAEDDKMEEETAENTMEQPENDEQAENEKENENLPKNNEDIEKEDEVEEKSHEANPQANPSSNDPSAQDHTENAEMERGTNDNVETNDEQAKDKEAAPYEQAQEQVGEDKQSTGRAELDKSESGHRGEKQAASRADSSREKQNKHENKPGKTDQLRTLGDINEEKQKQAQTLNVEREDDNANDGGDGDNQEKEADAFQHVKQAKKDDLQAVDAATKEQADEQPVLQKDDNEDGEKLKEDEEVPMDVDDEDIQVEKSEELKPEKVKDGVEKNKEKTGNKKDGNEEPSGETGIEVDGENVLTENIPRGTETSYHTRLETPSVQTEEMTIDQYMSIREWLTSKPTQGGVSAGVWRSLWQQSGGAARALCERLRLVLEPTMSSRRAGDFRTGRAINMRRVIPYIASHFRKDRIWLRRTKPAKREYKIAIAVDDSSSMADNRSKELAFESLALVSQALNLLESGDLAVLSFGEKPNLLHPFPEQFSEHSGSKILEQLQFNQTKTKIAQLLDFCCVMFEEQTIRSDAPNAKLLVIVGDGRNIFAEGEKTVLQAVRRARQQGIFLVYVVIDNPENRDSIMDIRKPVMDSVTNKLSFISYLDAFPFSFYLILRDMTALPNVLGDALRQWFELAANTS